jgi:hypothetical protein
VSQNITFATYRTRISYIYFPCVRQSGNLELFFLIEPRTLHIGEREVGDKARERVLLPASEVAIQNVNGMIVVRGRDVRRRTPPAQIRTSGFPASGSYLGCLTAKRMLGQG